MLGAKCDAPAAPVLAGRPCFPSDLRVQLVDPNSSDLACAAAALRCLGYAVTPVSTVTAAASDLQSAACAATTPCSRGAMSAFDVVLADASAALSHDEAARSGGLFAAAAAAGVPVVLMGCSEHSSMLRALELGAADFLERPLSPLKLQNLWQHTVRAEMLRQRPVAQTGQRPAPRSYKTPAAPTTAIAAPTTAGPHAAIKSQSAARSASPPLMPPPMPLALPPPPAAATAATACCCGGNGLCLGGCSPAAAAGSLLFGADDDNDWIPDLDAAVKATAEPDLMCPTSPRDPGAAFAPWPAPEAHAPAPVAAALPVLALPQRLRRTSTLCSDLSCGTGIRSDLPSSGADGDGDGSPLAYNTTPTSALCGACAPPASACVVAPPPPTSAYGPPAAWPCCAWPPFVAVHGAPPDGAPGCVWGLPMCTVIMAPGLMPPPAPGTAHHAAGMR